MKRFIISLNLILLLLLLCGCERTQLVSKKKDQKQPEELFSTYYDKAQTLMKNMSIEEKIAQLFLIRFDEQQIKKDLASTSPAGYVLFAKDIEGLTKDNLKTKLEAYQEKSKIDLIFAVDEEGGIVTRVSRFKEFREEKFKSIREYYQEGGISRLVGIEEEKINLLSSLGFNLNLAPVADVSTDPNDFIYNRTLGEDVTIVEEFITETTKRANQLNFAITLKHFPGYGENVDTHNGNSLDQRSKEELKEKSLPPFKAGIDQDVPVIMISHNIIESYDQQYPASLSKPVHELLRELGFTGLILTDDLDMMAIQNTLNDENEAVIAFLAGNDLLMTSKYEEDKEAIKIAIQQGTIEESEIEERVKRILSFKYKYNIIK